MADVKTVSAGVDRLLPLATNIGSSYSDRPELIAAVNSLAGDNLDFRQALLHALLDRLAGAFSIEKLPYRVTADVASLFERSLVRIRSLTGTTLNLDDRFLKDLALCTGALFPAGERVVEPASALQRALLVSGGPRQFFQFIVASAQAGGTRPVFRLHVHLAETENLSELGWQKTCEVLASMLEANPPIKGVVGGSWFYDPCLPQVSPRLAFINGNLAGSGAWWFYARDEDENSGALKKSQTRRNLFRAGRYQPRAYVMFWARRCALSWLRAHQGSGR